MRWCTNRVALFHKKQDKSDTSLDVQRRNCFNLAESETQDLKIDYNSIYIHTHIYTHTLKKGTSHHLCIFIIQYCIQKLIIFFFFLQLIYIYIYIYIYTYM